MPRSAASLRPYKSVVIVREGEQRRNISTSSLLPRARRGTNEKDALEDRLHNPARTRRCQRVKQRHGIWQTRELLIEKISVYNERVSVLVSYL